MFTDKCLGSETLQQLSKKTTLISGIVFVINCIYSYSLGGSCCLCVIQPLCSLRVCLPLALGDTRITLWQRLQRSENANVISLFPKT